MVETTQAARISAIRRFNRFYTRTIGVLGEGHLGSPFSLTEVRILYELAHAQPRPPSAAGLGATLGLDPGHLSRLLGRLVRLGLVSRRRSSEDSRRWELALTRSGRTRFEALDRKAHEEVGRLLEPMAEPEQERLVEALLRASGLLGGVAGPDRTPYLLRPHRSGDVGWIVQRHGEVYRREYGWDERFEGLVARIGADFLEHFDPGRERAWIAERDGIRVGCVLLVRHTETQAKLRLLLVEPSARGLGLGRRLVRECTEFARAAGYRKIVLWTNSVLTAARAIYQAEGYRCVKAEPHHSYGHELVGETWELALGGQPTSRRQPSPRR